MQTVIVSHSLSEMRLSSVGWILCECAQSCGDEPERSSPDGHLVSGLRATWTRILLGRSLVAIVFGFGESPCHKTGKCADHISFRNDCFTTVRIMIRSILIMANK